MKLNGGANELVRVLRAQYPEAPVPLVDGAQMLPYQQMALYAMAKQFNRTGAWILEIGTGAGTSAYMLSMAARAATIVTLNPNQAEAIAAKRRLTAWGCTNVVVKPIASWGYLADAGDQWDMIYVDGDHNQIGRDLAWWNRLRTGGLLICHDYSPAASTHPSPIVYATLERFGQWLGRAPEALVVDSELTGMAGWYRREGETWPG